MHGVALDFTINLPMICGGAVFLVTIGHQLGKIATRLEYLGAWHERAGEKITDIDGRVSHIEGHLGLDK